MGEECTLFESQWVYFEWTVIKAQLALPQGKKPSMGKCSLSKQTVKLIIGSVRVKQNTATASKTLGCANWTSANHLSRTSVVSISLCLGSRSRGWVLIATTRPLRLNEAFLLLDARLNALERAAEWQWWRYTMARCQSKAFQLRVRMWRWHFSQLATDIWKKNLAYKTHWIRSNHAAHLCILITDIDTGWK